MTTPAPHRHHRALSWLAALVLLFHAFLPFIAVYNAPENQTLKNAAAIFGEKVLLCTGAGFQMVDLKDLLGGNNHPKKHKTPQCPLSYVGIGASFIEPLLLSWTPPHADAIKLALPALRIFFVAENEWRKLRTRAPPAFIG